MTKSKFSKYIYIRNCHYGVQKKVESRVYWETTVQSCFKGLAQIEIQELGETQVAPRTEITTQIEIQATN